MIGKRRPHGTLLCALTLGTLLVLRQTTVLAGDGLDVAIMPLRGSTDAALRDSVTRTLLDAFRALEPLRVTSLVDAEAFLGAATRERLDQCRDDACLVLALGQLAASRVVVGELDEEPPRILLRLRLLDSSTTARGQGLAHAIARTSREVPRDAVLRRLTVAGAALDLFPELASRAFGTIVLEGGVPGAKVILDGSFAGELSQGLTRLGAEIRAKPGLRFVQVVAKGFDRFESEVEVAVGQRTELVVDLDKRRSDGPLYVGAGAGLAFAAAGILGFSAKATAADWSHACERGACAPGFTRARYGEDASRVDTIRTLANGLYFVAGVATLSALLWYWLDPGMDPELESGLGSRGGSP